MLKQFGYQVLVASDGQEAVEMFAANRARIGLILMDIIMPNKNGVEAFAEIRELQPEVKALFISGYTAEFIQSRGMQEGVDLLMKPVQPMELLRRVRSILEQKQP